VSLPEQIVAMTRIRCSEREKGVRLHMASHVALAPLQVRRVSHLCARRQRQLCASETRVPDDYYCIIGSAVEQQQQPAIMEWCAGVRPMNHSASPDTDYYVDNNAIM